MASTKESCDDKSTTKGPFHTPTGRFKVLPRAQKSSGKKLRTAFKSPLRRDPVGSPTVDPDSLEKMEKEIQALREKEADLDGQISHLLQQGYQEEELQVHITKLHEYNEIKDIGQMLIGRIAVQQGVTTKDLYERFGLDLED